MPFSFSPKEFGMKYIVFLFFLFTISESHSYMVDKDAYTFDFNVKTIRMSRVKEKKLDHSIDILREIFASPEFKRKILSHRFQGRYQFSKNKGLSNYQIYKRLLKGIERLHPYDNNAMDVEVELYTDNQSQVVGFTNPRTKRIWMNTKYFNRNSPAQVASHLTHEWLHKLGFDHEKGRCNQRRYSVPYAIGYIVRDLAKRKEFRF
jgi:hypothetical protein